LFGIRILELRKIYTSLRGLTFSINGYHIIYTYYYSILIYFILIVSYILPRTPGVTFMHVPNQTGGFSSTKTKKTNNCFIISDLIGFSSTKTKKTNNLSFEALGSLSYIISIFKLIPNSHYLTY
jgi:hypothetical protein